LSLGVLGGIQPDRIKPVLRGTDDGLADRFLWAWPEIDKSDFKLARTGRNEDAADVAFAWLTGLCMGTDRNGNPSAIRVRLTRAAEDVLEEFGRETNARSLAVGGRFGNVISKARGHALRLACVLEHLWWCANWRPQEPTEISEHAMLSAIALVSDYYLPMAERVYGDLAMPDDERNARLLVKHLKANRVRKFNAREMRLSGGPIREAEPMNAACKLLVEFGLIRPQFRRAGPTKGRMAQTFEVNPIIFGA
jgi:hypothetical protein